MKQAWQEKFEKDFLDGHEIKWREPLIPKGNCKIDGVEVDMVLVNWGKTVDYAFIYHEKPLTGKFKGMPVREHRFSQKMKKGDRVYTGGCDYEFI